MDVTPLVVEEEAPHGLLNRSQLVSPGVKHISILGQTGSGKTYGFSAIISQLIHEPLGGVWLISKKEDQSSYDALRKWCGEIDAPFYDAGPCMTPELKEAVCEDDYPKWVIYDDFIEKDENIPLYVELMRYGRHFNVYCITLSQTYKALPPDVKGNTSAWALYPVGNNFHSRAMLQATSEGADPQSLKRAYALLERPEFKHSFLFLQKNSPYQLLVTRGGRLHDINRDLQEIVLKR